jgi:hypothetical protein
MFAVAMRDDYIRVQDKPKPFHLMTPAERTAARIAQNRAIDERIKEHKVEIKNKKPPASSSADYVRATPEERAALRGSLVRKVQS